MAEGSDHAAILIATSYQALNRALQGRQDTLVTDCTVLILFAGFYVEATLNHILDRTGKTPHMLGFPRRRSHPGLQDKLAYFYNDFVARDRALTWDDLYQGGITRKLRRKFPGFAELYAFRNDISHGEINRSAMSLATAKRLRQQAKDLVRCLYDIAASKRHEVPRLVTYRAAIASLVSRETPRGRRRY